MSKICLYEDSSRLIENVKPKNVQITKGFPAQANKNRTAFQQLKTYQQNNKQGRLKDKENVMPAKNQENKSSGEESNLCSDLIALKPIFKKPTVLSRIHFANKEYEEEIWSYLIHLEKKMGDLVRNNYMCKQANLSWDMRGVLIDWLVSVAEEYNLNENTLHLSVNYLDRFLSNISVIREKFQLVGATAMLLAGKMEEIYPPDMKEWSYLTGDAFSVRQFLKMEQLMIKILNFEMNTPTMLDFLKHLCSKHKVDNKTMYLAMYLSELVLLEGDQYLQYFPSKLAASSLVLARHTLFKAEPWPRKIEESAGYTLKQLSPVIQKQHKTFKSSPFKEQQAIQKKYASEKYQKVALLKPRILILDENEA